MDDATRRSIDSDQLPKSPLHGDEFTSALGARMLLAQVADHMPSGVVVVTADLHVRAMNRVARSIIEGNNAITVLSNRLVCLNARSQQNLEQCFRRLRQRTGAIRSTALRVARAIGCDLQLRIAALDSDVPPEAISHWCVWIVDPDKRKRIDAALLRELYGLTDTEATVAVTLFSTASLEAASTELQVTINTTKTHLKHIFQKCEVRSQAELLQMLALGPCGS